MRVLVTGGAGFIGVNLARRHPDLEWVCFDNFSTGKESDATAAGYSEQHHGDIRQRDELRRALDGDIEAVVHLAAQTGVPSSVLDPLLDLETNVLGSVQVLEACREAGVRRVVLASSAAPLGAALPPASESVLTQPISPYGASKLAMEAYAGAYRHIFELDTFTLRFSNVYGPFSYLKGSVVALWMKQLLNGENIRINGTGNQTRDFVHVDDICDAIQLSLTAPSAKAGLYQLGTGIETTVRQLAEWMTAMFKVDPDQVILHGPSLTADVARSFCDISKATRELGYDPRWSVEEGLTSTLDWFRSADPADLRSGK